MSDEGFYLLMLAKRDAAETALWQCYTQIFAKIGYYNKLQVDVDGKKVPLTQELLTTAVDDRIAKSNRDGFFAFRQSYMKAFTDGTVMLQLIKDASAALELPLTELEAKQASFASKSNPLLRTVYWYIDKNFVVKLPPTQQASFTVDCLMFGEWECKSFNLVGMHLIALACMLEVKQFATFLPPEAAKHAAVVNPHFKGFLAKKGIALNISFKDVRTPIGGAGAGTAKALDKGAKDSKAGKEAKDAKGKDAKGKDAKGKDAKDKDGKGKDAKGKDAKGKDAKDKDGKGKDAKGKDAKGKDAKGKDAKGKDAKAKTPAKKK